MYLHPLSVKRPPPLPAVEPGYRFHDAEVVIAPDGGEWRVAPEGYSGRYCRTCNSLQRITRATGLDAFPCEVCHKKFYNSDGTSRVVRSDNLRFFDPEEVRQHEWLHVTSHQKWGSNILRGSDMTKQPFVHLGVIDAAIDRKAHISEERMRVPKFYLFTVRLKADVEVAPSILIDADNHFPTTPEQADEKASWEKPDAWRGRVASQFSYNDFSRHGVTRYVNQFESPGTVSLLAHASAFEVVDRQDF